MRSFDERLKKKRRWLRFGCFAVMMLWAYPITQYRSLLVPLCFVMLMAYLCGSLDA